jgi:hypothetical protein
VGADPTRPSIARVYDAYLGGKTNYEVDLAVKAHIDQSVPEAGTIAIANRQFLNRALRYLSRETPITQFLDCGSGLPTAENTHEIVQRNNPDSVVVYVDNDPVVLAHGRALLLDNNNVHMLDADIFEPAALLAEDTVTRNLDFSEPLVLIHGGTLHHLEGDHGPDVMKAYIDALAPGSYVVFSHFFDPEDPTLSPVARRIEDILINGPVGSGRFRTRAEILAMLPGLDLVDPGLVAADTWWPDGPLSPLANAAHCVVGAVARKP